MEKPDIAIPRPTHCRLWDAPEFFRTQPSLLRPIKSYADDSHLKRRLLRCEECGQLYFYEFYETIDWVGGNDPQYRTLIPVADEEGADRLNALDMIEILQYFPRLQSDWPKDADEPKVWWSGKGDA